MNELDKIVKPFEKMRKRLEDYITRQSGLQKQARMIIAEAQVDIDTAGSNIVAAQEYLNMLPAKKVS